jgi:hypothetical protein
VRVNHPVLQKPFTIPSSEMYFSATSSFGAQRSTRSSSPPTRREWGRVPQPLLRPGAERKDPSRDIPLEGDVKGLWASTPLSLDDAAARPRGGHQGHSREKGSTRVCEASLVRVTSRTARSTFAAVHASTSSSVTFIFLLLTKTLC